MKEITLRSEGIPAMFEEASADVELVVRNAMAIAIQSPDDQAGIDEAGVCLRQVKRVAKNIEDRRKELKRPALDYSKAVDDEAKIRKAEVDSAKSHLDGQIRKVEQQSRERQGALMQMLRDRTDKRVAELNRRSLPVVTEEFANLSDEEFGFYAARLSPVESKPAVVDASPFQSTPETPPEQGIERTTEEPFCPEEPPAVDVKAVEQAESVCNAMLMAGRLMCETHGRSEWTVWLDGVMPKMAERLAGIKQ